MENESNSGSGKQEKYTGSGVLAAGKNGRHSTEAVPVHVRATSVSDSSSKKPVKKSRPNMPVYENGNASTRAKMPVHDLTDLRNILALLQDDLSELRKRNTRILAGRKDEMLAFAFCIDGHTLDFVDGNITLDGVPVCDECTGTSEGHVLAE